MWAVAKFHFAMTRQNETLQVRWKRKVSRDQSSLQGKSCMSVNYMDYRCTMEKLEVQNTPKTKAIGVIQTYLYWCFRPHSSYAVLVVHEKQMV